MSELYERIEFFKAEKPIDPDVIHDVNYFDYFNNRDYAVFSQKLLDSRPSEYEALRPFMEKTYLCDGSIGFDSFVIESVLICKVTKLDIRKKKPLLKAFLSALFGDLEPRRVYRITPEQYRAITDATDIDLGDEADADNLFLRVADLSVLEYLE